MTFDEAVQLIRARCGDAVGSEAFNLVVGRFLRQLEGTPNNLGLAEYLRTIKVADHDFALVSFTHHRIGQPSSHINIEPVEKSGWCIIGFHPQSEQRLCWTRRGEWQFEFRTGSEGLFQTSEVEIEVENAFDNLPSKVVNFPPR